MRGIAAIDASVFMPNETDNIINLHSAVELLQCLEPLTLSRKNARPGEEQDEISASIARIEAALPPDIHGLFRSRIRSGQPLVAAAQNGKCRSCYTETLSALTEIGEIAFERAPRGAAVQPARPFSRLI